MCIVAMAPERRVKLRRSGMVWLGLVVIAIPIHAAPTELDAPYGQRGYKHGAPNGAFRCPASTPYTGRKIRVGAGRTRRAPNLDRYGL